MFAIAGSGHYLPVRTVSSDELDEAAGRRPGWTRSKFAISSRHYAGASETSSFMAAEAARAALDDANWKADSIEVVVGACGVMEQPIPGTALLVQRRLGLGNSGVPAFDVNATCLSFLPALDHVLAGMQAGRWRRALVVSSDIASAALDPSHPEASVIFGDGAAAVALEAGGPHQLRASRLESYGEHVDLCRLEAGGTRLRPQQDLDAFLAGAKFRMEGAALYRATARRFPGFLQRLLDAAKVTLADLSTVIPHQASAAALDHLAQATGDRARIVDVFANVGNMIATSLPYALHVARRAGRLQAGTNSLLIGSAAGISLGGAVIRW
jgi:3-oxoacyl-[acyl-carrier-protein] synthase-3